MDIRTNVAVVSVMLASATLAVSCGGDSPAPTAPSAVGTCRTYATNQTQVTNANGTSITRTQACQFSTGSNQLACTLTISTCGAVSFTLPYASTADFVDEVSVIPPKMLPLSQNTAANACGITNATYTYDAQKRLTVYTINGLTTTYTAWDGSGRPTAGNINGALTETYAYNDAARTATLVQTAAGQSTTTVYTYDANGQLLTAIVNGGSSVTTNTILSTGQVCK